MVRLDITKKMVKDAIKNSTTYAEAAEKIGMNKQQLYYWREKFGLHARNAGAGRQPKGLEGMRWLIKQLRRSGVDVTDFVKRCTTESGK